MEQPRITLEPLVHRDMHCIAVRGHLNQDADKAIRAFPKRSYSKTNSCWYVLYSSEALTSLSEKLSNYQPIVIANGFGAIKDTQESKVTVIQFQLPEGYHEALLRIRYSQATVKTYESQMRKFLAWLIPKTVEDISDDVIKEYQLYLAAIRKVSTSTQNTAVNAIKFYLEKVNRGERKVYYVERPIKEVKLPRVLSQEEVKSLIEVTRNIKHRCMLLILYSSGLRMSELLNLRWRDFDTDRMQLFVEGGKGNKDRMTLLSPSALEFTKYYMKLYNPVNLLFEGPGGKRYSPSSVNNIVHQSASLAGIKKRISAHTLRHSFATHLLEQSTDIRYIQVLMGHENSKTTERYTHVTTKGFSRIKSPLDGLGMNLLPPEKSTE